MQSTWSEESDQRYVVEVVLKDVLVNEVLQRTEVKEKEKEVARELFIRTGYEMVKFSEFLKNRDRLED